MEYASVFCCLPAVRNYQKRNPFPLSSGAQNSEISSSGSKSWYSQGSAHSGGSKREAISFFFQASGGFLDFTE
jgi:hypothetical protein